MLLSINTSTRQSGLALMNREFEVTAEYLLSSMAKDFNGFMPALISLIDSCNAKIEDIEAICIATGPGSFTGLRVGLATAKGISYSLNIPVIGVSSLEALAMQLPYAHLPLCAMISSRKGEVFFAIYLWDNRSGFKKIRDETALRLNDMASVITEPTLFIGNDINTQKNIIKDCLKEKAFFAPPHLWNLKASSVGIIGIKRFLENDTDDIRDLVPAYYRPPDIRPSPFSIQT